MQLKEPQSGCVLRGYNYRRPYVSVSRIGESFFVISGAGARHLFPPICLIESEGVCQKRVWLDLWNNFLD